MIKRVGSKSECYIALLQRFKKISVYSYVQFKGYNPKQTCVTLDALEDNLMD